MPSQAVEDAVEKVVREVKAYQTKIVLYCSLKVYLENSRFTVLVENRSERVGKDPDEPDLQVLGDRITLIEEKGSLPTDKDLLEKELLDVIDYQCERLYRGEKFTPQVVLLCPSEVYRARRGTLRRHESDLAVLSYPYPVEDPIKLQLVQGRIADPKLASLLEAQPVIVDLARTIIPTVKFLKQAPPVPYTAWAIWQVVWASVPAFKEDFPVKYPTILKECQKFYPSWISQDTEQITAGRVNDALELLRHVGWVEFEGKPSMQTVIQIHYTKGDRIRSETFHFLARKHAELRSRRDRAQARVRIGVLRVKKPVAKPQDRHLTDFFPQ
jgi:hypothetical protein